MFGYYHTDGPKDEKIESLIENDEDVKLLFEIVLWTITIERYSGLMYTNYLGENRYVEDELNEEDRKWYTEICTNLNIDKDLFGKRSTSA